jgi:hypothetical protein
VHNPTCGRCRRARAALAAFARDHPVLIDPVDVDSRDGVRLVRAYRPRRLPLVLVAGQYFGSGRVTRSAP